MQHLRNARAGERVILVGILIPRPGQITSKCLTIAERSLIRYFLSEGHDLANKQGTLLRHHELESNGQYPKRFFKKTIYIEKEKGE
jgi:hypothetical protein